MNGSNNAEILDLLARFHNRFFGKYRGTVTQVDQATLRLKAKVPAVLGEQETGWCMPCVPYAGDQVGMAFLPEIGAGVWIEFEGGDVSYPIWTGCYWRTGEYPSEAAPQVKVVVTAAKHKLIFDDSASTITITDASANKIVLDSNGILIERAGKKILVNNAKVDVNDGGLEVL